MYMQLKVERNKFDYSSKTVKFFFGFMRCNNSICIYYIYLGMRLIDLYIEKCFEIPPALHIRFEYSWSYSISTIWNFEQTQISSKMLSNTFKIQCIMCIGLIIITKNLRFHLLQVSSIFAYRISNSKEKFLKSAPSHSIWLLIFQNLLLWTRKNVAASKTKQNRMVTFKWIITLCG